MTRRWVITTTLNDNLLRAKLPPLLAAFPDLELLMVTDRAGPPIKRVHYLVPRRLTTRIFGRLIPRSILLFKALMNRRTERVMVYNAVPHLLLALPPAKLFGKPLDLHMIGGSLDLDFAGSPDITDNRLLRRLKRPARIEKSFRWMAFKHASRLFIPGRRARAWLLEQGVPESRIHMIHSAVDTEKFAPSNIERDIDVLIVANLHPRKRPELTIEILELVLAARPDSKFAWIGDGYIHDQVHDCVKNSSIRNAVEMVGHTDDVAGYYQRSKVLLLNSVAEGLSLAVMEAMSAGCVPVTADVGDMPDVIHDAETGFLIREHDTPEAYTSAILRILESESLRETLATNARTLILQEHSYEAMTKAWLNI